MKKITLIIALLSIPSISLSFDRYFLSEIGSAYFTHLTLHELGHQALADSADAVNPQMHIGIGITPASVTYDSLPSDSRLSFAAAGYVMEQTTFDYALTAYRNDPTLFNRSLMIFSTLNFAVYSAYSLYIDPDNDMLDANTIRGEIGIDRNLLMGLIIGKSLTNWYRAVNPNCNIYPTIGVDITSVNLMINYRF